MSGKLNHVHLFEGLNSDQLDILEPIIQEVDCYNKEAVFKDGEDADYLWFVREGRVDLRFDLPSRETSKEYTISTIIKNWTFGWSTLVSPHQYKLSAYCATDFTALSKMERHALVAIFEAHPDIGYLVMSNLSQVIANRFHLMQEELATRSGHNIMNSW